MRVNCGNVNSCLIKTSKKVIKKKKSPSLWAQKEKMETVEVMGDTLPLIALADARAFLPTHFCPGSPGVSHARPTQGSGAMVDHE